MSSGAGSDALHSPRYDMPSVLALIYTNGLEDHPRTFTRGHDRLFTTCCCTGGAGDSPASDEGHTWIGS